MSVCTLSAREWNFTPTAKSLSEQTYSNIEWVLLDFIYDQNKDFVEDLSKKYKIKTIHIPNIRTDFPYMRDIARNRNELIKHSTGEHIIFLDDYCTINNGFVEKHLEVLNQKHISCGRMLFLDKDPSEDTRYELLNKPKEPMFVLGPEWTYTGNLGVPRHILYRLGGFDPVLSSRGEDCDFGIRAVAMKCAIYYNPNAVSSNLPAEHIPYKLSFDHKHFLKELNEKDAEVIWNTDLQRELGVRVEERYGVKTAVCLKCGAEYILEVAKYIYDKKERKDFRVSYEQSGLRTT